MATSVSKAWSAAGTLCVPISGHSFSNVVLALRVGAALLQSIAALRNRGGAISQTVFPYVPLRQRLQRKKLHANFTFEYHHCATILLLPFSVLANARALRGPALAGLPLVDALLVKQSLVNLPLM